MNETGREEVALLLPEIAAVKQPATLIAPVGAYAPSRHLSVTYQNKTQVIILTKIIERSHHSERLQYSAIHALD